MTSFFQYHNGSWSHISPITQNPDMDECMPVLILVSKIFLFHFIFSNPLMADNADPTQYDPRAQAMEEIHFDWRCIVCCMVALSPFHLEQQHLPGPYPLSFTVLDLGISLCC